MEITAQIQFIDALLQKKTTISAARLLDMTHKEYLAIFEELLARAAAHSGIGPFTHLLTPKGKRDILERYQMKLFEQRKSLMDDPAF